MPPRKEANAPEFPTPLQFFERVAIPSWRGVTKFGAVMEPFQRAWITALDPTLTALCQWTMPPCRKFMFDGTKGCGKDLIIALAIIYLLVFSPRPLRIQVGADDQDQADETRKSILEIFACRTTLNELLRQSLTVKYASIVNDKTGSIAEIKTRDSRGGHGSRPDLVVINELSHISDEEFANTMADNAAKMQAGVMVVGTNAGTLDSWQHRWKKWAVESADWYLGEYKQTAPWLSAADIEGARRRNPPARFERLYLGIWTTSSGDTLDREDIDRAFASGLEGPMAGHDANYVFAGGLDLSSVKDHSAFCIVAKHRDGRFRLAELRVWKPTVTKKIDQAEIENVVLEAHRRFRIKKIRADKYQADYITDRLRIAGVPIEAIHQGPSVQTEQAGVTLEQFTSGNIDLYPHDQLERDLRTVRVIEKNNYFKLTNERGKDGHGDALTSLILALTACRPLLQTAYHTVGWQPQREVLDALRGDGIARSRPATGMAWGHGRLGARLFGH